MFGQTVHFICLNLSHPPAIAQREISAAQYDSTFTVRR
jgi:hypothetical protein